MTNRNWLLNFYAVCKNAAWHFIKTKDFLKWLISIEIMNDFNIMRSTDRNIYLLIKFDFIILDQFYYMLGKFGLLERECRSKLLISYRHILTNNRWIFFLFIIQYNPKHYLLIVLIAPFSWLKHPLLAIFQTKASN